MSDTAAERASTEAAAARGGARGGAAHLKEESLVPKLLLGKHEPEYVVVRRKRRNDEQAELVDLSALDLEEGLGLGRRRVPSLSTLEHVQVVPARHHAHRHERAAGHIAGRPREGEWSDHLEDAVASDLRERRQRSPQLALLTLLLLLGQLDLLRLLIFVWHDFEEASTSQLFCQFRYQVV